MFPTVWLGYQIEKPRLAAFHDYSGHLWFNVENTLRKEKKNNVQELIYYTKMSSVK